MMTGETYELDTEKKRLDRHDYAKLFPQMPDDRYAALRDDIEQHGQYDPILMMDGMVVDGVHRWKACHELGLTCKAVDWTGSEEDLLDFVVSHNLQRRHLTPSQLAAVAYKLLPLYEEQAKARMSKGGKKGGKHKGKKGQATVADPSPEAAKAAASDLVARNTGISGRTVRGFKRVAKKAPGLVGLINDGKLAVKSAERIVDLPAERLQSLLDDGVKAAWGNNWVAKAEEAGRKHEKATASKKRFEPTEDNLKHAVAQCAKLAQTLAARVKACLSMAEALDKTPSGFPDAENLRAHALKAWQRVKRLTGEDSPHKMASSKRTTLHQNAVSVQ